jgi:hypothetical protein
VPQEARLGRRLQQPRCGFASAVAQRCLTKRSPELRKAEVQLRRITLPETVWKCRTDPISGPRELAERAEKTPHRRFDLPRRHTILPLRLFSRQSLHARLYPFRPRSKAFRLAGLSRVSSTPITNGPLGTNVFTSNPRSTRLASRLDQLARLRTRW